jgi:uncharacterized protein (TIGR02266 family)
MVALQERRRFPRTIAKLPVTIETTQGVINTEIHDISSEGAFVRCLDPLRPAEAVRMAINIPHSDRRLMIDSEVVWVNIHGPDYTETPRGMGVQFTQISRSDRQFLNKIIMNRL